MNRKVIIVLVRLAYGKVFIFRTKRGLKSEKLKFGRLILMADL